MMTSSQGLSLNYDWISLYLIFFFILQNTSINFHEMNNDEWDGAVKTTKLFTVCIPELNKGSADDNDEIAQ